MEGLAERRHTKKLSVMETSSSNSESFIVEVGEEFPYPSHVIAPHFVTVKLSGKDKYDVWKTQMLCLLRSHGMLGFIDDQKYGKWILVKHKKNAWMRSDSLVTGWILGSLSEEVAMEVVNCLTSKHNNTDFTAKDAWDELQRRYGPSVAPVNSTTEISNIVDEEGEETKTKEAEAQSTEKSNSKPGDEKKDDKKFKQLNFWIKLGILGPVRNFLKENNDIKPTDKITIYGDTVLHVAVRFATDDENHEILKYLLSKLPEKNSLKNLVNSDGSTLLHVAAIFGNTEAAKILLKENPDLLLAEDKDDRTPLALSLNNMHTDTSQFLINHIKDDKEKKDKLFSGESGDNLLVLAISSKKFGLAMDLLEHYETIHGEAVLMAIAQNFPSELNFWGGMTRNMENIIGRVLDFGYFRRIGLRGCCCLEAILNIFLRGITMILVCFLVGFCLILYSIEWSINKKRVGVLRKASRLSYRVCEKIYDTTDRSHRFYLNPVFEATRQNASEVVEDIVSLFPKAIEGHNEHGHDFIQYAVINRSERIYNMLFQMSEDIDKNIYKKSKDRFENNLLHLASKLAPSNKLELISGAALQIQRELQWYKEVEGFVNPLIGIQKNSLGQTPGMVFTEAHKDLVIQGEKWMKKTAQSYTITAALITTIVFAAAITVPGGNNQDTGIPIFTNNGAFTVFAISDAISLFTAVTSLLMFLSILTARFPQKDFLVKLPRRLIIGLLALFIATTTMIIAFGATLFLMFGERDSRILIIICVLTALPIIIFVRLQFPLIADLVIATYGPSIFDRNRS